jgi:NAD(P)-dependent dehydrogenase (short-subunit alcohol dehydrogenase family)
MAQANGRKCIFITGGASGIGLATAQRFAREGWFVGLADIDDAGMARALESIGADNGSTHRLDVRDRAGWKAQLAAFAKLTDGRLDVLMNNAGLARGGFLEQMSEEDVDLQIDVNLKGVVNGCRAGFDLMAATPGAQVVNVASVAGLVAPPQLSIYAATKFAVRALSEALDAEYARVGVGVKCVMPWFIDTPLLDKSSYGGNQDFRASLKANKTPVYPVSDVSDTIWRAVHSDELHHVVGAQARRMRFMTRWAPGLIRKQLRRQASPS